MTQAPYVVPYMQNVRQGIPANAQSFVGFIQDGKIFQSALEGPQPIGVTSKSHDELQQLYDGIYSRCQEYYDALVEAGVIVPEPTQEQIVQQQAEQLRLAQELIVQGQKTQEVLLTKQNELAAMLEKLTISASKEDTGGSNEHVKSTQQLFTSEVGKASPEDTRSLEYSPGLQGFASRPDESNSGSKPQVARPRKRDGTFAKRPGS